MNTTTEEKKAKQTLLDKCWTYLNDNFHKFSETNKIKIALSLGMKDMPTQLEGKGIVEGTRIIIVRPNEAKEVKSENRTIEMPGQVSL